MTSPSPPTSHSSSSVPIVVISILGITTTVSLLVAYYFFIMRCFFRSRPRGPHTTTTTTYPSRRPRNPLPHFLLHRYQYDFSPRGLDDSTIRSLPIVPFRRSASPLSHECAVCLSSFRENEKLRLLPGCSHHFHVDCIDTWLHSTPTCPLCRTHVSPFDLLAAAQLGLPVEEEEEDEGGGRPTTANAATLPPGRKVMSMGDECIARRSTKEGGLWSPVQPMRRSFSMDSSTERQLCLAVQEALTLRREQEEGSGRIRRTLFSFAHGRSSRSAILPLQVDDV